MAINFLLSVIIIAFLPILEFAYGHFTKISSESYSTTNMEPNSIETLEVLNQINEIEQLKWETLNPKHTEKLLTILDNSQDDQVQYTTAEALALRDDQRVFDALVKTYSKLRKGRKSYETTEERTDIKIKISKFMVIHYAVCPTARSQIINFLVTIVPSPSNKLNRFNCYGHWQGLSGADFIGNQALRDLILFVQKLREWNGDGSEIDLRKMSEEVIIGMLPSFPKTLTSGNVNNYDFKMRRQYGLRPERKNWDKITDEDIKIANNVLFEKDTDEKALLWAINVLIETYPFISDSKYHSRLIELLNDAKRSDSLKRAIVAVLGSEIALSEDTIDILLRYVNEANEELVIGAAKALRWKQGIPVDPLLNGWKNTNNDHVKTEIESALATIPDKKVFTHLLKALFQTKFESVTILRRRLDNLKLWYVMIGNERNQIINSIIKDLPPQKQDSVIFWLRDTSSFAFFKVPPRIAAGWFTTKEDNSKDIPFLIPKEISEILSMITVNQSK
jgi:hypothetical protein